jgi:hypothetical protein
MGPLEIANYNDPLDPLRRFVPTPLRTRFRLGACTVKVESNDFSLLPALSLDTASEDFGSSTLTWTLVRDLDAHGLLEEPLTLVTGQLTVVGMGQACVLGFDHERCELFCFIGRDVDTKTFQEYLVPFLCRLSGETAGPCLSETVDGVKEDALDA